MLLKNTRDKNQFTYLEPQVYPEDSAGLYKAYLEATKKPHAYLVLDFAQDTDDGFVPTYSQTRDDQNSILPRPMRRLKANYHTQQVLKTSKPKLRKAILPNCKKELLHSINEYVLSVLNGNSRVSCCAKRRLKRYKCSLRSIVDRGVPLASRKRVIIQ